MPNRLTITAFAALLLWPTGSVLADDDEVSQTQFNALEQRVLDLESTIQLLQDRLLVLEGRPDQDTLGSLSCGSNQIAKFNGVRWACGTDALGRDTLAELACADGELVSFDATLGLWVCTPAGNGGGGGTPDMSVFVPAQGLPQQNCEDLRATLAAIPSSAVTNLVLLDTGTFDCGATPLAMRSGIDIEGAGIMATKIIGNPPALPDGQIFSDGVVNGAEDTEIRNLTVEHAGPDGFARFIAGIDTKRATRMSITNVNVVMTRAPDTDIGIVALDAQFGVKITDVSVLAQGIGILTGAETAPGSIAELTNVNVQAFEALLGNFGGTAVVRDSLLIGIGSSLRTFDTAFEIFGSVLAGPVIPNFGTPLSCTASFGSNQVPLDANCNPSAPF